MAIKGSTVPAIRDDGQLISDDGQLISDDGQLISDDGQLISDDGQLIRLTLEGDSIAGAIDLVWYVDHIGGETLCKDKPRRRLQSGYLHLRTSAMRCAGRLLD